jgi:hypothetical protein
MKAEQEGTIMKKLIILLIALLMCLPALAETLPEGENTSAAEPQRAPTAPASGDGLSLLAPYAFALPQDVSVLPPSATSVTFVHGNGSTRVVAQVVHRVSDKDGDHIAELERLLSFFAPSAGDPLLLPLAPGFCGLQAVAPYALEGAGTERVDQVTVMIHWQTGDQGELLILSGYDMAGDEEKAQALLDMVLAKVKVQGEPVFITEE